MLTLYRPQNSFPLTFLWTVKEFPAKANETEVEMFYSSRGVLAQSDVAKQKTATPLTHRISNPKSDVI